jgi:hypothetical protein
MQANASTELETPTGIDRDRAVALIESARAMSQAGPDSPSEWVLDAQTGADVVGIYGLRAPPSGLASNAEEAAALAGHVGYPVALKRVAPGVVHKSDAGSVTLNLKDAAEVRATFTQMVGPAERGLVQQMAPQGLEVIVGSQRDPQFGPLVMFGLGGTYVEVLRDVVFRLAPMSPAEAREMIDETAAGRLLAGVRGQPPGDMEGVIEALWRVGHLMADLPQISEVDLNPLIVGPAGEGVWAVDVRLVLKELPDMT